MMTTLSDPCSVIPFRRAAARQPMRFAHAARQAILAAGYVPGLGVSIGCDEDGDEWAVVAAEDDVPGRAPDPAVILVTHSGFTVSRGCAEPFGTFEDIHEAVATARADMVNRLYAFDYDEDAEAARWAKWLADL